MKRDLIPLCIFLLMAGFLAVGLNLDPREVPSPLIDKPAPAFMLSRLDEPAKTIATKDRLGQAWLLNVWA
jgi:cytochrome c biogenesis protein CcmG/thiol:disulfide interchange protein DsbE